MDTPALVACSCSDHTGIITLQHDPRRNALSAARVGQRVAALAELRAQGLRRRVHDSEDYREGVRAVLEKRPPVFRGR